MNDPIIELSLCLALTLLLGGAAWHKFADQTRFGATLRAYEVLPSWSVASATPLLPLIEALLALALLYPPTRRPAADGAVLLLLLYTTGISINLLRGRRNIDCGCFASSARVPLSGWLIVRNMALVLATCALLLPVRSRPLVWVDALTLTATLGALSLLWAAGQRLAQTGPLLRRLGGSP